LDEAETAAQFIPENVQGVQEVNHLLKNIAGHMLQSIVVRELNVDSVKWKLQRSTRKNLSIPDPNEPLKRFKA
jgi:hypothetical protein